MFKRKPKPRDDGIAARALDKIQEQNEDKNDATDRFAEAKQLEEDGDWEAAIDAYVASAAAWERYHASSGHPVPVEPYMRLGVLFRRAKAPEMEERVLQSYLAHAGRDPDMRIQERLERFYELYGPAE